MTAEMRMKGPHEIFWIEPLANFLVNEATMSKFRQYLRIIQLYLARQLIGKFRYLFAFFYHVSDEGLGRSPISSLVA